jgi:hypothetical protein
MVLLRRGRATVLPRLTPLLRAQDDLAIGG